MTRVFVSHAARVDAPLRERLASNLRAAGVDVWMAPDSIEPGEPFAEAIDRALESSDHFILLLSPASLASRWVQTEVNAALDRAVRGEITILPVAVSPVAVPPLLSTFQQIDLTQYDRGLHALGSALGVTLHPGPELREGAVLETRVRQRPSHVFAGTVRADLERGARTHGYLVQPAPAEPATSRIDLIVEVALLRIGVLTYSPGSATTGRILADTEHELRANPHRVAGVLAISPGDATTLTPYQLLDAPTPNAMLLQWNESDGSDAVAAGIPLVAQAFTGQGAR